MDEAHSYTSFHGSNVYHVLKRMKNYMKKIQIIGASATLDNPKEFFSNMYDLPEKCFNCGKLLSELEIKNTKDLEYYEESWKQMVECGCMAADGYEKEESG